LGRAGLPALRAEGGSLDGGRDELSEFFANSSSSFSTRPVNCPI
jgi:hypothetical protein